jgi:hypothetical protein
MKLTIKVEFTDAAGVVKSDSVVTAMSTIVAWERNFKRKASDLGSGGVGIEDIAFLAWHRLTSLKREARSFDEWLEGVVDLELLDSADPGPPTKPDTSGVN